MKLPYRQHHFSLDDYEFVLVTRKFHQDPRLIVAAALIPGIFATLAAWEKGFAPWAMAAFGVSIFVVSLAIVPILFFFYTGQLFVQNYLLGNITSIMGYVNWPPVWQNVIDERAVTFNWSEISEAVLRPAPWVYAMNNLNLELHFRDGKRRILRVPNIDPTEVQSLVDILAAIALRRGFRFSEGPPLHPPQTGLARFI